MAWWNPLTKQMLLRFSRHPTVHRYARQGMKYMRDHPSGRKISAAMSNSWVEIKSRVESSTSAFRTLGFDGNNKNGGYAKQFFTLWNEYKGRVVSFIVVNFMGILFFFQFGSLLWQMFKQMVSTLFTEPEKKLKKNEGSSRAIKAYAVGAEGIEEKKKKVILQQQQQPQWKQEEKHPVEMENVDQFSFVFSDGTDAHAKQSMLRLERDIFGNVEKPDFSTSFKFRMGEDEEFRPSAKK
ncbi:hypothetical protein MOQ_007886 [Trypanosoma cruzi marinkellei]|uniref:Uncharacterized protein n=1 Tax=Trypanosoma cruzi marinkellei TaxID=85056 RepID=K2MRR7_TRYCR|nr:hypothetical protein MOQ_007886 [Trypanosoma cruzi marinkellei]